jgi:hypothetical protein
VIEVTVRRFHALTPRARQRPYGGIHAVTLDLAVFDAKTGLQIGAPGRVKADLEAYTGPAALAAEARGETQRARIVRRIAEVVESWLGRAGPGRWVKESRVFRLGA